MRYDVVKDVLEKADESIKIKFKNVTSIGTIKAMLSETECKVKHFDAVLRAIDFVSGLENELTKDLVDAGVLIEYVDQPVAQPVKLLVPENSLRK